MSTIIGVANQVAVPPPGKAQPAAAETHKPKQHRSEIKAAEQPAQQPLQASYEYNEALRQVVITLLNPQTGTVVREIPAEQVQRVAEALLQTVTRVFTDEG